MKEFWGIVAKLLLLLLLQLLLKEYDVVACGCCCCCILSEGVVKEPPAFAPMWDTLDGEVLADEREYRGGSLPNTCDIWREQESQTSTSMISDIILGFKFKNLVGSNHAKSRQDKALCVACHNVVHNATTPFLTCRANSTRLLG
jgi:hypothetical protein